MKEEKGNILSQQVLDTYDAICFTSNGIVKANGELVMGAGIAKSVKDKWPDLPKKFGALLKLSGENTVLYWEKQIRYDKDIFIASFPTKHHWKDKSDIELIRKSAHSLAQVSTSMGWGKVALTRPGCGLGGLNWANVKKVIEPILNDRFTIFYL